MESHALTMGTGRAQWWPYQLHDGRRSAILRCPKCGLPSFVTDHAIDEAGHVAGRFACRAPSCRFEGSLTLRGWVEEDERQPEASRPAPH